MTIEGIGETEDTIRIIIRDTIEPAKITIGTEIRITTRITQKAAQKQLNKSNRL